MDNSVPRVLLVDDDRTSRTMLQLILHKAGYAVVEAEDGHAGLGLYQRTIPDLVLLDAKMPGMDGFECCRKIRQLPGGKHTPILMVTGLGDQTSVNEAFAAGATDFVNKPVQAPILMGRMGYLIQAAQAEQALRNNEEKYRSLITSLQEVIFQLDAGGHLTFVNPVWHKLMGYSLESSLGRLFEDFLHPAEQQRHRAKFDKAWKQPFQPYRYRSQGLTQSGNLRWIDIQLCANLDEQGNVLNIAGRLNDITDRTVREQYRSLEYAVTRVLSHAGDVNTAIRRAVQATCGNLGFQLGEFWQIDPHCQQLRCQGRWHLKKSKLQAFSDLTDEIAFTLDEGIPSKVWQSGQAIWISDIAQDDSFIRRTAAETAGLRSLLGFPVGQGPEKLGIILLFSQMVTPPDTDLLRMLTILGRQLGQYLQRKYAEQALHRQNQLLQLELQRAAKYVEALLPGDYDRFGHGGKGQDEIWINTLFQPSSALGGDAFDYAWLDDRHLMFYLLDVAGHGVKSALLSVSILNTLRKQMLKGADFYQPQTVVEALNAVFQGSENGDDYFTFWYGVYDIETRKLVFASAGHPPGVLVKPLGISYETCHLDSDGIPIGLFPEFPFEINQCEVPAGSSLYLFSDGVYEVPVGENHDIWGLDAWTNLLQTHKTAQNNTLRPLLDEVRRINRGDILEDDFSILEVSFA